MAESSPISFYDKINHVSSKKTIPLDLFLEGVRKGKWEDEVNEVRVISDKKERDELKETLPSVTISGEFEQRYDANIKHHTGFIGIDIDDKGIPDGMSLDEVKSLVCCSKYVYACFLSASGRGLCVVMKVNPVKHKEAFQGICEYFYKEYNIICDPTSINVSRPRFVSFDPGIFINHEAVPRFVEYPKEKPPKKIEKIVYAKNDFDLLINEIVARRLNLCDSYHDWVRICFAIVHQFGEAGRNYFHIISQFSSKYESKSTDKQYTSCVRHKGSNVITLATLYYYCKQAGLEIYSERTRKISYAASSGKKAGLKPAQIAANLKKFEDIEGEDVEGIINQVTDNNIELNEDSLIEQVEQYIRQNYNLRRNAITRFIDNDGVVMSQEDMNSLFIKCKKIFEKISYELLDRLIHSDFIPTYNPFMDFFADNIELGTSALAGETPEIDKVLNSIKNQAPDYCLYFGKKWLVGMISAMHGVYSPLVFVLLGKQRTGKTEWFRRLLPKELNPKYYAESKLDAGKDDFILMTQKVLVMDDEMSGKSKKEARFFKDLTSKQIFNLREPYGHHNVDLVRIAMLGGTGNEKEILVDSTGNTRLIPVIVETVDKAMYNSVDKKLMMMEAYHLYKSGFDYQVVSEEDQALIARDSSLFEVITSEAELICKYYSIPEPSDHADYVTATDIKVNIERLTQQRLSLTVIGRELARLGFEQVHKRMGNTTGRFYKVIKEGDDKNMPF